LAREIDVATSGSFGPRRQRCRPFNNDDPDLQELLTAADGTKHEGRFLYLEPARRGDGLR
jgi:hypothetical protein